MQNLQKVNAPVLYTYDIPTLMPGDIILSKNSSKQSIGIQKATASNYSHAMLYTEKTIVHADGGGVFTTNPQRKLFLMGESAVFRPINITPQQSLMACQFALNLSGSIYSIPEAIRAASLHGTDQRARSNAQFCSRLVAQAYSSVGLELVSNPDYCHPGQFENNPHLHLVGNAIRPALPGEIKISETPDTVAIHQQHTFDWLKKTVKLAKKQANVEIMTIVDAINFAISHPKFNSTIASYIKKSQYLEDYMLDKIANPHRYDTATFKQKIINENSIPAQALTFELETNINVKNNATSQLSQFDQIRAPNLEAINIIAEMHAQRLFQVEERIKTIKEIANSYKLTSIALQCDIELNSINYTINNCIHKYTK
ncbi:hypothetical protein [Pseudomonas nitroreducens]|uniref:hypothetical protein n=1 Tax=Pseudomonas nitroreducens TaxID=46680 RepID=UPI000A01DB25|nr:hypothetical protein [Pseudomonas nitroreducens]NMZ61657.1 hypothetical protein [Pseudomonas nitroreducens]SNT16205.1 Permuted papain-like amidase enzyme, YaeF/YiiX, C92 family [Pseudomonas nitroreducens]